MGSANLDIVVPVPRLPAPGETVLGGARGEYFGGKGANQAVAAARAGGRVRLLCLTGEDPAGRSYRRRLREEGIARSGLLRGEGRTGAALIVVDDAGGNQIAVSPGANALLTPRRLRGREALLDYGDVALAQLEIPAGTVRLAFRAARRRGATTILNPAPASGPLPAGLLALVDVLVPNETEAAALLARKGGGGGGKERTEEALLRLCRELRGLGPAAAVLTAGARGAFFMTEGGGGRVRPPAGLRAADATGAGDAFCGALAVRLGEGAEMGEAVRFAVAAASLSVRKRGAQAGLPGRAAVLRALKRTRLERAPSG
ncbi:MAG: ribokinase [bacterium]